MVDAMATTPAVSAKQQSKTGSFGASPSPHTANTKCSSNLSTIIVSPRSTVGDKAAHAKRCDMRKPSTRPGLSQPSAWDVVVIPRPTLSGKPPRGEEENCRILPSSTVALHCCAKLCYNGTELFSSDKRQATDRPGPLNNSCKRQYYQTTTQFSFYPPKFLPLNICEWNSILVICLHR